MANYIWPPSAFSSIANTVKITDSNGSPIVDGQQTMANSLPVVIASNQTPIPVSFSEDQNYGTPTATTLRTASMLGMGSSAVTAANPVFVELSNGASTYVGTQTGQLPTALGQTTMAGSVSVAIASNQSSIPVTISEDQNYGTPTATTLRTASMLGMGSTAVSATNPVFVELSTGAGTYNTNTAAQLPAALGQTTMAASLSVAIASNQSAVSVTPSNTVTTPLFVEPGNGTNSYTSAAITAAQLTQSTATAVPVSAGLAMGWDGTTHREISVTTAGNVNVTNSNFPSTLDTNYGTPGASTLRTASMLGMGSTAVSVTNPVFVELSNGTTTYNAPTTAQLPTSLGQNTMANSLTVAIASNQSSIPVSNLPTTADTNYGTPGASTLRTASMLGMGSTAVSVTNPVFVEPGNGTNSYSSAAITAAQFTQSTATAVPIGANLSLGWDGTTHREISVSTTGLLGTTLNGLASQNFLALDTSSTNITSAAYVQLFASTTAAVSWVSIFNGSGSVLELATGASGSEVVQLAVPPGGIEARLAIAASVRVAVRRYPSVSSDMTSGFFTINLLG